MKKMCTRIEIDPDGDPILATEYIRYQACSDTLWRASRLWETMLFGPWKEAKPRDGT
jgi:hypothetical protein